MSPRKYTIHISYKQHARPGLKIQDYFKPLEGKTTSSCLFPLLLWNPQLLQCNWGSAEHSLDPGWQAWDMGGFVPLQEGGDRQSPTLATGKSSLYWMRLWGIVIFHDYKTVLDLCLSSASCEVGENREGWKSFDSLNWDVIRTDFQEI